MSGGLGKAGPSGVAAGVAACDVAGGGVGVDCGDADGVDDGTRGVTAGVAEGEEIGNETTVEGETDAACGAEEGWWSWPTVSATETVAVVTVAARAASAPNAFMEAGNRWPGRQPNKPRLEVSSGV
jgi:hypothetical protein